MNENWTDVVGYVGYYQVSDLGNIRSLDRNVNKACFGNKRLVVGKVCRLFVCKKTGYVRVRFSKEGSNKKYLVHRIVADAFIPNPENKSQVNHINGNKLDNRACNLERSTASENIRHAIDCLGVKLGEHFRGARPPYLQMGLPNPAKKKVQMFDKAGILLKEYNSATEAEKDNGITKGMITQYCSGKRNNKTYNFKYSE